MKYRYHIPLSNGQLLTIQFTSYNSNKFKTYSTAIVVGKFRKENNRWLNRKRGKYARIKQTGRCGLEALSTALKIILEFRDGLSKYEELQVGWADEKRKRAYKYLLRYDFFLDKDVYFSRNMNYWEIIK